MKSESLEKWAGGTNSFGEREKFKGGQQHSSLSSSERAFVDAGGVVFHRKGSSDTKVFVKDENGGKWSVTVRNIILDDLKSELVKAGYNLPTC